MFAIACKIIFCLLLAALLGFIIGYLVGKTRKCDDEDDTYADMEVFHPKPQSNLDTKPVKAIDSNFKPKGVQKDEIEPDDLKKIKGVGKKIEVALNELGIYTFSQVASWNDDNVAWVDEHLVFKGRIQREDWINQAKILASGKDTEFSKKYEEG